MSSGEGGKSCCCCCGCLLEANDGRNGVRGLADVFGAVAAPPVPVPGRAGSPDRPVVGRAELGAVGATESGDAVVECCGER